MTIEFDETDASKDDDNGLLEEIENDGRLSKEVRQAEMSKCKM